MPSQAASASQPRMPLIQASARMADEFVPIMQSLWPGLCHSGIQPLSL